MGAEITYELSQVRDREEIAVVIEAVPSSWQGIEGLLIAPKRLYEQNRIAPNTRLLSERPSDKQVFVGADDLPFEEERRGRLKHDELYAPNILAPETVPARARASAVPVQPVIARLPSSVWLKENEYCLHEESFIAQVRIAADFIRLGYQGLVRVCSRYYDHCACSHPEEIVISDWDKRIFLLWNEDYRGKKENLKPILAALERKTTISLRKRLKESLLAEDYETAARIRDQIEASQRK